MDVLVKMMPYITACGQLDSDVKKARGCFAALCQRLIDLKIPVNDLGKAVGHFAATSTAISRTHTAIQELARTAGGLSDKEAFSTVRMHVAEYTVLTDQLIRAYADFAAPATVLINIQMAKLEKKVNTRASKIAAAKAISTATVRNRKRKDTPAVEESVPKRAKRE
tara:strand:- start:1051 stop:1548 length:498 start_codon:yes stop_codon:yes gene_type:complete